MESILTHLLAFCLAPLFPGIINATKAFFAGKKGPPVLMKYFTLAKLFQKGSVYSTSTSLLFRASPVVLLATAVLALLVTPIAGVPAVIAFQGDVLLLFYLLGLGRFFSVLAALDTASPFEGMGAAREVFFATLAEATVFTVLIVLYRLSGELSFQKFFLKNQSVLLTGSAGALMLLVVIALFMVLLVENSRVPVDDPQTHLELTMIHEVMILDHSGPDLALIELASFVKLFFYSAFIVQLVAPFQFANPIFSCLLFYGLISFLYVGIGIVESITARFRLNLVPKFILTSFALAFFTAILTMGIVND